MKQRHRLGLIICFAILILAIWVYFLNNFTQQHQQQNQPNVLLIVIDALRPDHLGCYGYSRNTSPNIDKLATEGVMFTQAVCQIPETQSSVASFLTSTSPFLHYRDYPQDWSYLNPTTLSLARVLRNRGYYTGLITDFLEPNQIFQIQGVKEDFNSFFQTSPNNPKELTETALHWLKKNKIRFFFLYLHYFGSHGPYNPSLPYSEIFLNDHQNKLDKQVPVAKDVDDILGVISTNAAENNVTSTNYYICKYDGKIRVVDEQIGLLLEGIKKLGLDKKTLVILIADHGESLGQHHLYFQHVYTLYDELIKVPFIIKYDILIPENRVIKHQVQLIDVMPTVLDILGIKDNNCYMEGISLLPFILGEKKYLERYAFGVGHYRVKYFIRTENWKLIYEDYQKVIERRPDFLFSTLVTMKKNFPKVYELYNLKDDPYELHNLVDDEKEKFLFLKQKLDEYINFAEKEAMKAEQLAKIYLKRATFKPLDEKKREKLRNLGYVQ